MSENKVDYYRLAPTFLYKGDESQLFETQEEVERAWLDGWHKPTGPESTLISKQDWGTKADTIRAVEEDPRYVGIELSKKDTTLEIRAKIEEFEEDNEERF